MDKKRSTAKLQEEQPSLTCGMCGGEEVTTTWIDHTFDYGVGEDAVKLKARIPVRQCRACEFEFLDHVAERLEHEALCRYFGVLPPAEVRRIREGHRMSRADFAKITGLGEASLGRWENSLNIQTKAYDRYLRLLAHPDIMRRLEEIVASETSPQPPAASVGGQFSTLKLTDDVRKEQEGFRLRVPLRIAA